MPKPDETFIDTETYDALLDALLAPRQPSLDPRGQLVEILGGAGGIWPRLVLHDRIREAVSAN